jgi:hypothetical protein
MNLSSLRFAGICAWVASTSVIGGAQAGPTVHPIIDSLARGAVGEIHIDQTQSDIEGLLHHPLPVAAFSHNETAASLGEPNDLRLLGIDNIDGAHAFGVELRLDDPPRGGRRIIAISVSMVCEDIPALRERLRYDEALAQFSRAESVAGESDEGRIVWGIDMSPTCQVRASKRIAIP